MQSIAAITLVGLNVDGDYVGRSVSIRSESDQFYSELINIPVTDGKCKWDLFVFFIVTFLDFDHQVTIKLPNFCK